MFKIIAASLITLDFLFHLFLDALQYKSRNRGIPDELRDVYDTERYLTWKRYTAEKIRLGLISNCVSYALIMSLLLADVFVLCTRGIENPYVATIAVLGIYVGASTIVSIPFSYCGSIVIEGKYGFNKSTIKTFVADLTKSFIIETVLFLGLACLFQALHQAMGDFILLLFSIILFAFVLLISFLYPLFSKIFNKFTPLEEGELRTALTQMLERHQYKVSDIKVMDASRRTTKSNAYFTGFGNSKTIVLYDNMLKMMSNEEILAIFAHEMGHGLHRDTLKNAVVSFFQVVLIVLLAWLLVRFPSIYADFGYSDVNYGLAAILLFSAVMPVVSLLTGFVGSYLSRKAEYRADEQTVIEGYGDSLVSGLKTLFREDLGDLNPHPLIVLLYYSHPTLLQRVRHIEEFKAKTNSDATKSS